jgi:hypothetical protein
MIDFKKRAQIQNLFKEYISLVYEERNLFG